MKSLIITLLLLSSFLIPGKGTNQYLELKDSGDHSNFSINAEQILFVGQDPDTKFICYCEYAYGAQDYFDGKYDQVVKEFKRSNTKFIELEVVNSNTGVGAYPLFINSDMIRRFNPWDSDTEKQNPRWSEVHLVNGKILFALISYSDLKQAITKVQ
jgi:hypothetical protein